MNVLMICGSRNQTTMMLAISDHLREYNVFFTPHYADGFLNTLAKRGLLEWTVIGNKHAQAAVEILKQAGKNIDIRGEQREYDLVVTCADLVIPNNIRGKRIVLVQEGLTDPETLAFKLVRTLNLPRYLASTSAFGLSDAYVRMCVASEGYGKLFESKGVDPRKIRVTGIPNFDNCAAFASSPGAYDTTGHVLVATSDFRETLKYENRKQFILDALEYAAEKPTVFKLHPNENVRRAVSEIKKYAPFSPVLWNCDINPLIAHCDALVTKYSSVAFVGVALGKPVISEVPQQQLVELCPLQNNGTSALNIAMECIDVLQTTFDPHLVSQSWRQVG